jgi:2-desacetyl-2-hydroxyethyl bacteriochlorophyllide A dehydrogenase
MFQSANHMYAETLVCSEPGHLQLLSAPAPARVRGEVLVKPLRIGICGTDYHIYEGSHPFLKYPRVMGHELAVEVIETPSRSQLAVGDICVVNPYLSCGQCVACRAGKPNCCVRIAVLGVHRDGGMTELMSLPADNLIVAPGLSPDECATVEFLAIGAHAVRRGMITDADKVLVVGTGPIGIGVALFARLAGGRVWIHDRDVERAEMAAAISGASILPRGRTPTSMGGKTTGGEDFSVVIDATGSAGAIERGFDFVEHGGRYVLVSVVKETITFKDPDFHRKEMTLLGSRNATAQDFDHVIDAIRARKVPIDRRITHRTTLQRAVEDIPRWATQKTGLVKAVIEVA